MSGSGKGRVLLVACVCAGIVVSIGCGEAGPPARRGLPDRTEYDHAAVVSAVVALHAGTDLERQPHLVEGADPRRTGAEFDVNRYFEVLTHVAPPAGHVLDYVYYRGGRDGVPLLYWRKDADERFGTAGEYLEAVGGAGGFDLVKSQDQVASRLVLDGSPASYLEFVVFRELAGQFYLFWHDSYDDTAIVTTREAVDSTIAALRGGEYGEGFTEEHAAAARALDVAPSVTPADGGTVDVSLVIFTKWGGFIRRTYTVSMAPSVHVARSEDASLLKWSCGVKF